MFSILYHFLQYRDDTIAESELEMNDQNPHLADNVDDHEEDTNPYDSHIYQPVNKRNGKKDNNGSNPVQSRQNILPPIYSLPIGIRNDNDEMTV